MASITQRSGSYRVRIFRKNDKPISKSFSNEPEATQWLKKTQAQLELGLYQEEVKNQVTLKVGFREAVEKYIPAHSVHKGNHKTEAGILRILSSRWEGKSLSAINKQDIVLLKDDLLAKGRAASTVNHYLNALSQLYQIAMNEWGLKVANPITGIKRMSEPQGRMKRLSIEAETALLACCHELNLAYLADIIAVAIETGMRCGEILSMRWEDMDFINRRVLLRDTKNGDSRQVPLSSRVKTILEQLSSRGTGDLVFPYCRWAIRRHYTRVVKQSAKAHKGVQNPFTALRFHDLRHEALSRLSDKGLNVMEIAHISGHRTLAMLRRYTHPCHKTLLGKLDKGLDRRI
ncbi:MAG: site-specific integrase [Polynucleobacter sp.]|uniref:tyrosine-type recombinase/integrase n=1 Tax=Polynucleobacter sp. TaxID=2029855 RepID=UPI002720E775|nr:site-specific integrase [Polynucleobacter sp.]MDO8714048.1 site-specific integrase [Polynucleobacter sp.]